MPKLPMLSGSPSSSSSNINLAHSSKSSKEIPHYSSSSSRKFPYQYGSKHHSSSRSRKYPSYSQSTPTRIRTRSNSINRRIRRARRSSIARKQAKRNRRLRRSHGDDVDIDVDDDDEDDEDDDDDDNDDEKDDEDINSDSSLSDVSLNVNSNINRSMKSYRGKGGKNISKIMRNHYFEGDNDNAIEDTSSSNNDSDDNDNEEEEEEEEDDDDDDVNEKEEFEFDFPAGPNKIGNEDENEDLGEPISPIINNNTSSSLTFEPNHDDIVPELQSSDSDENLPSSDDDNFDQDALLAVIDASSDNHSDAESSEEDEDELLKAEEAAIVQDFSDMEQEDLETDLSALALKNKYQSYYNDDDQDLMHQQYNASDEDEDEEDEEYGETPFWEDPFTGHSNKDEEYVNKLLQASKEYELYDLNNTNNNNNDDYLYNYFNEDHGESEEYELRDDYNDSQSESESDSDSNSETSDESDYPGFNGNRNDKKTNSKTKNKSKSKNNDYNNEDDFTDEETDQEENLPNSTVRRTLLNTKAKEVLGSAHSSSRPPPLASWVMPSSTPYGIIDGQNTRSLNSSIHFASPNKNPHNDILHRKSKSMGVNKSTADENQLFPSSSLTATPNNNTNESPWKFDEFINTSEFDDDDSIAITTPSIFKNNVPLSAFRNRNNNINNDLELQQLKLPKFKTNDHLTPLANRSRGRNKSKKNKKRHNLDNSIDFMNGTPIKSKFNNSINKDISRRRRKSRPDTNNLSDIGTGASFLEPPLTPFSGLRQTRAGLFPEETANGVQDWLNEFGDMDGMSSFFESNAN